MCPWFCLTISGRNACAVQKCALQFTPNVLRQWVQSACCRISTGRAWAAYRSMSSCDDSRIERGRTTPALLISTVLQTSKRFPVSNGVWNSERSRGWTDGWPSSCWICFATAWTCARSVTSHR